MSSETQALEEMSRQEMIREMRQLRADHEELKEHVEWMQGWVQQIETIVAGGASLAVLEDEAERGQSLDDRVHELEDSSCVTEDHLRDEQIQRSQEDSKLRQRINKVAEKGDIDIADSDLIGDDKIQTAISDGAEAVVGNRVFPVHERAVDLLQHIGEWGDAVSDKRGKRFLLTTGEARGRLNDLRGENLQSTEVIRVFDKIEEWAASSPRKVTVGESQDGQRRIEVMVEAR